MESHWIPKSKKRYRVVEHTCNSSTLKVETGGSEVQGHPQLPRKTEEGSLASKKLYLRKHQVCSGGRPLPPSLEDDLNSLPKTHTVEGGDPLSLAVPDSHQCYGMPMSSTKNK